MDTQTLDFVCRSVQADSVRDVEVVQTLWSGYGEILRLTLAGCDLETVIAKRISPPMGAADHPRGWDSDISHQRKLKSYQVETVWYREGSSRCDSRCRVPQCYVVDDLETGQLLILEDLDAVGFPNRHHRLSETGLRSCLSWLAHFHSTFLFQRDAHSSHFPKGLWETGTYWHLATRPDEYSKMPAGPLKDAAERIDHALRFARFQTLVHGDAKVANFCFDATQQSVAAVDFQYVGGGCGMKDVAYFLGSCLDDSQCEAHHDWALNFYFQTLRDGLSEREFACDVDELESEWRTLFPVAWADFHRFMLGWCPGHPKLTAFGDSMVEQTLRTLGSLR